MNHELAVRLQAAERHVAGELSPEEQDQFEEHFFICPECAGQVRMEQAFAANARAILREWMAFPQREALRSWTSWIPRLPVLGFSVAFNVILLAVVGYHMAANRPSPGFYPTFFAPAQARGVEQVPTLAAGTPFFGLRVPAPEQQFKAYSYEVLNEAGGRERSGSAAAPPQQTSELYLSVPARSLASGVHTLVLRGDGGNEVVSRFKFRIQR